MRDMESIKGLNDLEATIIENLKSHVQQSMPPDPTGHDWPHVMRVLKNAMAIHASEGGNKFQLILIALTHDLYDHKFFTGSQTEAEKLLYELLVSHKINTGDASEIVKQVFNLSYKNGQVPREPLNHEGKIVQDADRIEAIGAIGIARAFAYGGFKNRLMNKEEEAAVGSGSGDSQLEKCAASPRLRKKKQKDNTDGTTFEHFFEKLLKLYDLLNTETAKKIAKERFDFMQEFVKRFEEEWNN
jgi:uncharacterized protein